MHHFCTYFDHIYLAKGIALYRSLAKHCPEFKLWVLCLSQECLDILSTHNLENVALIPLEELEEGDTELLVAKSNRTLVEYYYTLSPTLPLFVLNNAIEVDQITYLDSDLLFFSNPEPIFEEMSGSSIGIVEHRFPENFRHLNRNGIYNVSWISYRRDRNGIDCLQWYRDKCNEWCYQRWEHSRFADQKYLEFFEELFDRVHVIRHKGANLASFNIAQYEINIRDGQLQVDEHRLIFFHFHGFRQLTFWLYDSGFSAHCARLTRLVKDMVFLPYIKALRATEESVHSHEVVGSPDIRIYGRGRFSSLQEILPDWILCSFKKLKKIVTVILTRTGVLFLRSKG